MEEKELKTSPKQRVFIILIAIFMLGSIIASYAAIVASGAAGGKNATSTPGKVDEAKVAKYEEQYNELKDEFAEKTKDDFDKFIKYRSEITAYNEASANDNGVQKKDLKEGSGRKLTKEDSGYLAYYVGWCADETIFDSTFDDNKDPKSFKTILDASQGLIEGWSTGIDGMKLGGIREITVPGSLAYGDSMEICGGKNKPLKFIIMAKARDGELNDLATKLNEANMRLQYARYGIDYDAPAEE